MIPASPQSQDAQQPRQQQTGRPYSPLAVPPPQISDAAQAVNTGHVLGRHGKESAYAGKDRSAKDLSRGLAGASQANLNREAAAANSSHSMQSSAARAELEQVHRANATKIYSDMADRSISQSELSTQLQAAMMRNRAALMQALMRD